ncbi:MAG: hypothetical protein ACRENE_10240, partial [Polyangiaceae bacterium]
MGRATTGRFVRALGATALGVLGAAASTLASPSPARAQAAQLPVDLTWRVPAECPSREWVLGEIGRLLSGSHDPRIPTTATVVVVHDETAQRWRGRLALDARDAHSERMLEAESCNAVASAAALVLA